MHSPSHGHCLSSPKNVQEKQIFSPLSLQRKRNSSAENTAKSVAQRCSKYRQNLMSNQTKYEEYKQKNIARAKRNRDKEKSEEEKQRIRALARQRQRKYRSKQREIEVEKRRSGQGQTGQDVNALEERRERNRLAVRKHRAKMTEEKKLAESTKRMKRYHAAKENQDAGTQSAIFITITFSAPEMRCCCSKAQLMNEKETQPERRETR